MDRDYCFPQSVTAVRNLANGQLSTPYTLAGAGGTSRDVALMALERVRILDFLHYWEQSSLMGYQSQLKFLFAFGDFFGVSPLIPTTLERPPLTPAIALAWGQLFYSLRMTRGRDGELRRVAFKTTRGLRSAASAYYTLDSAFVFPWGFSEAQLNKKIKQE